MPNLKSYIARLLPSGNFARSVTVLASGTVTAQIITVLASPILTRFYSPEEFGMFAVFAALLAIITVVSGLRYEMVVPVTRRDGSAANVLALSLVCVLGMTALTTAIVALGGRQIAILTNVPMKFSGYFWYLPVGVALGGSYQSFNIWAIRKKAFSRIVKTRLQQSLGMASIQTAMGFAHMGPVGLVIGQIVGQTAGLTHLIRTSLRESPHLFKQIKINRFKKLGARYYKFPLFDTWAALGNTASVQLPPLLFAALYNPAVAGIYLLANRVMNIPMTFVAQSIGQVFFSQASQAYRQGNLPSLVDKIFSILSRIIITPLILFAFVSPDLFSVIFGEQWRIAGVYAAWISVWIIMQFIYSPLSVILIITEHPLENLYMQIILFTVRIVAVLAAYAMGNELMAVAAYSISSAVVYGGGIFWIVCHHCEISPSAVASAMVKEVFWSALLLLPFCLITQLSVIMLSSEMNRFLTFALMGGTLLVWAIFRGIPIVTYINEKAA